MLRLPLSLICVLALSLAACAPEPEAGLPPGTWTGGLTPMNHPDMVTPLTYDVSYDDTLTLNLGGPDGMTMPARDAVLRNDTLYFVFDEPDAGIPLQCALGPDGDGFAGRCTDAEGKWARFTMTPPAE